MDLTTKSLWMISMRSLMCRGERVRAFEQTVVDGQRDYLFQFLAVSDQSRVPEY